MEYRAISEGLAPRPLSPSRSRAPFGTIALTVGLICVSTLCFVGARSTLGTSQRDSSKRLKLRVFFIRHGLSCSNVLNSCAVGPSDSEALLPELQRTLKSMPDYVLANADVATLNASAGLHAKRPGQLDCTVDVLPGDSAKPFRTTVHHLYLDPTLTDCSRTQSFSAGHRFLSWCRERGVRIDFVGSSFLRRAMETSHQMFAAHCEGLDGLCQGVVDAPKVVAVPYISERAPVAQGPLQADNFPMQARAQSREIRESFGKSIVDTQYAKAWPRIEQQFEKFKAFLALVLAPSLAPTLHLQSPREASLRRILERTLPNSLTYAQRPPRVKLAVPGGEYRTGRAFAREEYESLRAPEVTVAIVAHGEMLRNWCGQGVKTPHNNDVLEKLFILEETVASHRTRRTSLRELAGPCPTVMRAPSQELVSDLARSDIALCNTPFDVARFLNTTDGYAPNATPCMQLGNERAFRILPPYV